MNKRYRELEKKAIDARCTYERLLNRLDTSKKEYDETLAQRDVALEQAKNAKSELDKAKAENVYTNLEPIIDFGLKLREYPDDFLLQTSKQVKMYARIFNEKKELLNVVLLKCRKLKKERELDETTFKLYWSENSKREQKEYNKLSEKCCNLLAEINKAKDQFFKMDAKFNSYIELKKKYAELKNNYCISNNISIDEFYNRKEVMAVAINKAIEANENVIDISNIIFNQAKELNKIVSKLSIAKDKMEEAEYQFKEYKNMINVA